MRAGLELDFKLLDVFRLKLGRRDPLLHFRHRHDDVGVRPQPVVQVDVVGQKSSGDRSVHRIRHGPFTEQERSFRAFQAFPPDRRHTIDVGLCARPDLEAGEMAFEVHGQGLTADEKKTVLELSGVFSADEKLRAIGAVVPSTPID